MTGGRLSPEFKIRLLFQGWQCNFLPCAQKSKNSTLAGGGKEMIDNWVMSLFRRSKPSPHIIFVVDDELPVLELAKTVLSDMGHDVRAFSNPEEALKEFPSVRPALVLTDYWMPRMSGMDLIRECRRLNPEQKAVLISGTVDGQIFANAAVKPDRFVAKPYQIQSLMDLVTELLAER